MLQQSKNKTSDDHIRTIVIIKYLDVHSLLPPQFPQEKPVISVFPPIRHHLMDKQGVYVTCPLISNVCIMAEFGETIKGQSNNKTEHFFSKAYKGNSNYTVL